MLSVIIRQPDTKASQAGAGMPLQGRRSKPPELRHSPRYPGLSQSFQGLGQG